MFNAAEKALKDGLEGKFTHSIETSRMLLKPVEKSHVDVIYDLATSSGDLHTHTHIPENYTREDAELWVNRYAGAPYFFVLTSKETGEVMGVLSVVEFDFLARRAEVGYWIGAAYRGKAYMAEALRSLVTDLFTNTTMEKVIGRALDCNEASAKTLRAAGFAEEARLPKHEYHNGEMKDVVMFGINKW